VHFGAIPCKKVTKIDIFEHKKKAKKKKSRRNVVFWKEALLNKS